MEERQQTEINFSNSKYTDEYMERLLLLAFAYYDHHNDKEKYQSGIENIIKEFGGKISQFEIKTQLKYMIDFVGKYASADKKFIQNSLESLKMKSEWIELFKSLLNSYNENVELMKQAMLEKVVNHRVIDFSHSFNVKYCDSLSEKVDFVIKMMFKYYDDEEKVQQIELDLSLNQFYSILNEFQKIDTMIKTLI